MKYISLLLSLIVLISCKSTDSAGESEELSPLENISKYPDAYIGQEISIDGIYIGWGGSECEFPYNFARTGIKRSDWLFSDYKKCIYVNGGYPNSLSEFGNSKDTVKLKIYAIPEYSRDNKIYLKYRGEKILE